MSDTTKLVINACYGGFNLSREGYERLAELKGLTLWVEGKDGFATYWTVPPEQQPMVPEGPGADYNAFNEAYERSTLCAKRLPRTDPDLVKVVEELGAKSHGRFSKLKVVELKKGTLYRIDEYDGYESVETKDGIEWEIA